jgi:hypothetical protein
MFGRIPGAVVMVGLLIWGGTCGPGEAKAQTPRPDLPPFEESTPPPVPDYADPASWSALPDRADFADFSPEGLADEQASARADVFYMNLRANAQTRVDAYLAAHGRE